MKPLNPLNLDDFMAQMSQIQKLGSIARVMGKIQLNQMKINAGEVEGQMAACGLFTIP